MKFKFEVKKKEKKQFDEKIPKIRLYELNEALKFVSRYMSFFIASILYNSFNIEKYT